MKLPNNSNFIAILSTECPWKCFFLFKLLFQFYLQTHSTNEQFPISLFLNMITNKNRFIIFAKVNEKTTQKISNRTWDSSRWEIILLCKIVPFFQLFYKMSWKSDSDKQTIQLKNNPKLNANNNRIYLESEIGLCVEFFNDEFINFWASF